MNELRESAKCLYNSPSIVAINGHIERDIEKNKFAVRRDRDIHADVGSKKHVLELLSAYNPIWLRIALETIYGRVISVASNQDCSGLTKFILNNFLASLELFRHQ